MTWTQVNQFLVKEHMGLFKAANNFDIFELSTGKKILECREEKLGIFTKLMRFTDYKNLTPFNIQIRDLSGNIIIEVSRGIALLLSKVQVTNGHGQLIGSFKQKLFSIGGKFSILDKNENEVCTLQGNWLGWDFRFLVNQREQAQVTKKWMGIGQEFFTTADNYVISLSENVAPNSDLKKLMLAAVMCIDMVLKNKNTDAVLTYF